MTTKVTIDAHAGWPVDVQYYHPETLEPQGGEVVPANETRTIYIYNERAIRVIEVQGVQNVEDQTTED